MRENLAATISIMGSVALLLRIGLVVLSQKWAKPVLLAPASGSQATA